MIKKLLVPFICCYLLAACKPSRPEGVMSQAEVAQLITEIYIAEAKMDNMPIPHDSAQKLFTPFEEAFLKKKKLNDTILKVTYRYYIEHPKELEKVYEVVIDSLALQEQKSLKTPPAKPK